MKILHIAPHYGGGVGSVVLDLVTELQRSRLTHNILVSIDVSNVDHTPFFSSIGVQFISGLFFSFNKYVDLINSADIVLVHYWNHPLLAYFLSTFQFPTCNLIFWTHTSGLYEPNIIPDRLLGSGIRVVFSSSASFNIFSARGVASPKTCSSIHSVRDLSSFLSSYVSRKYSYSSRLLYIGTVSSQKMHKDSLDLFKELADRSFMIDIVGDPCDSEFYDQLCHHHYITFHGHQSQILKFLSLADIFIYPLNDRHYGTGEQVILEAMSTGLPVICFDNPAESAIITNEHNGLLVNSPSEFIESVASISLDITSRAKLGRQAHTDILNNFSVQNCARDFIELFNTELASSNSSWSGKVFDVDLTDFAYGSMLICSFIQHDAFSSFVNGNIAESLSIASHYYKSVYPALNSLLLPTKASPFQYQKYFPSSIGISRLCALLNP